MDFYSLPFEQFSQHRPWPFHRVANVDALDRMVARLAVDAIKAAGQAGRQILIITPVGPLDYAYWARLCNEEQVSCEPLVTMNMDEYIDDSGEFIPETHPLSFRQYLNRTLVENFEPSLRPDPANLHFPDPREPAKTTELVESFGGADLCFGGCGLTGHFAFNDPPEPGEPCVDDEVRSSKTRCLTICRESQAQMCMGGSNGNWDIIPKRAVTLGMYELLLSKKVYLTFMRGWHAGVLRRVLFGPVTGRCPGSFIQEHAAVEVILTELAAAVPVLNVAQATGEAQDS
jgi:glucosamine-6-phosphate deaminase